MSPGRGGGLSGMRFFILAAAATAPFLPAGVTAVLIRLAWAIARTGRRSRTSINQIDPTG